MLPNDQWRWIDYGGRWGLDMRYVTVGFVRPDGDAWVASVNNCGRTRTVRVASPEEGRARVEAYWAACRWWRTVPRRD